MKLSSNTAGLHTVTGPCYTVWEQQDPNSFTAILHLQGPVHSHTHTQNVMKQRIVNSCIIQSSYTKTYQVIRMRVHKNYISNNFSNSALPPTTMWEKTHTEEFT
jgi:hypothetical protein